MIRGRLICAMFGIPSIACSDSAAVGPGTEVDGLPRDFAFEIATHAPRSHRPQSTRVILDRGGVEVMTGAQGLNMAILVPRVLEPVTEPLTMLAQLESGPEQIGEVELELPPGELEDGVLVVHDVYLIFSELAVLPDDFARLRVVLTDATGRTSELRRTVRLLVD